MTTGTKIDDYRRLVWTDYVGGLHQDLLGLYRVRSWSGSDDPVHHKEWNAYTASHFHDLTGTFVLCPNSGSSGCKTAPTAILQIQCVDPAIDPNEDLKLWSKLDGEVRRHGFNAAIALGEGHKTLQTVLGIMPRILSAVRLVKAGNPIGALQALGAQNVTSRSFTSVSTKWSKGTVPRPVGKVLKRRRYAVRSGMSPGDTWLELKYGWLPLYSDVFEAMKAVYALTNRTAQQKFRVTKKVSGHYTFFPLYVSSVHFSLNEVWRYRTLTFWLSDGYTPSIASDIGLTDPASLAWELLPFSFVADWFIPISTYLNARAAPWAAAGHYAFSTTIRRECVVTDCTVPGYTVRPGVFYNLIDNSYARGAKSGISAWGAGGIIPKPRFHNPLNGKLLHDADRVASTAALVSQVTSSWGRKKT